VKNLDLRFLWWLIVLSHADQLASRRCAAGDPSKVLVVRLDAIGDFVLWLDAAKELRALYPADRHQLTLLGNRIWVPLAQRLPYFDAVWELDRRRFVLDVAYRYRLMKRVADQGFGTALHPTFGRDFLWGDAVIRASGAGTRIGSSGSGYLLSKIGRKVSDRWYTRLVPATARPLMELRRNAEFMRGLGLCDFRAGLPRIDPASWSTSIQLPPDFFVICPSASDAIKRWSVENFARIAEQLSDHTGWPGLICGATSDAHLGRRLVAETAARIEDHTGRTSITDLARMISRARLVIGNDTGAIHLAAASGTPSVCIMGGGHYGNFLPYDPERRIDHLIPRDAVHPMPCFNCDWKCIYRRRRQDPARCIANVSVDSVWREVLVVLRSLQVDRHEGSHSTPDNLLSTVSHNRSC
jgi:ADP-heptose:LPS heptosyltransferase